MSGTRTRLAVLGVAAVALMGGACSSSNETSTGGSSGTTAPAESITITDVWARSLPTGTGAVYLQITASEDDALLEASVPSDIAGEVQIHETMTGMTDDTAMSGSMDDGDMEDAMTDDTAMSSKSDDSSMSEGSMTDDTMGSMTDDTMGSMTDDTMGSMGDGKMTMQPVDKVDLPAGETVAFKPGGYHIMLLDMPEALDAGTTFEVTLTFEKAGTKTVTAEVRDA